MSRSDERQVVVVVGTRPEAVKLFPVILALRAVGCALAVVTTGQHGAAVAEILALHGISPDVELPPLTAGDLTGRLTALLAALGRLVATLHPRLVIVQGDTASALAGALAAHHAGVPVAHVEAGLRTADLTAPWPEEAYRRMLAQIATFHFAPTALAAEALAAEAVSSAHVHVTGNTIVDALHATRALPADPGERWQGAPLIAVTTHRRENLARLPVIAEGVRRVARETGGHVVLPLHGNDAVASVLTRELEREPRVTLSPPLPYRRFVELLDDAALVLTDSGGVQEEAVALGKPVVIMRETSERPEGIAAGYAVLAGTDPADLLTASRERLGATLPSGPCPYGDGQASGRIARVLLR